MAFVPFASWNSRSITHLANYLSRSLPMNSSDESVFLTAGGSQCTETGLVGCPNPIDVAKGLRNLQQNNWTTISVERVISIWPNRFDELACERKNGCRLLVSKNRVIGGH